MIKKKNRFIRLAYLMGLSAGLIPLSNSYAASVNNCFVFDSNTQTITSYSQALECPKDVTIPTQINGVDVLKIGTSSFQNMGLTSLTFPSDSKVVEINSAFAGNKLTSFTAPSSLKRLIGSWSFAGNPLKSVTLNEGLEEFGGRQFGAGLMNPDGSFNNEKANFTLKIPSTVTKIDDLQDETFYFRHYDIPQSVTDATGVFYQDNKLMKLDKTNKTVRILQGTNIGSNTIPNTVNYQGTDYLVDDITVNNSYIFANYSGTNPFPVDFSRLPKNMWGGGASTTFNLTIDPTYSQRTGVFIEDGFLFQTIQSGPDAGGVKLMKNLDQNRSGTTLTLKSTYGGKPLLEIGGLAFLFQDIKVDTVVIPEGVKNIEGLIFGYTNIKHVELPSTLTNVDYSFFQGAQLESIKQGTKVNEFDFTTSSGKVTYYLKNGGLYTIDSTTNKGIYLRNVNYNDQSIQTSINGVPVTEIHERAFNHLYIGKDLVIPDTIEEIGDSAFYDSNLETVTLSKNLKTIGAGAFIGGRIRDIIIPSTITNVSNYIFVSNNGEKTVGYKVAGIVKDDTERQALNNIFFTSGMTEASQNLKLVTQAEAALFDRTPPSYTLTQGTGVLNNIVTVNGLVTPEETLYYKIVDPSTQCVSYYNSAISQGYKPTTGNISLSSSDSGKKLCTVGVDSSYNTSSKELTLGTITTSFGTLGVSKDTLSYPKTDTGGIIPVGITQAVKLSETQALLFGNTYTGFPGTKTTEVQQLQTGQVFLYDRSKNTLNEITGITNNTGKDVYTQAYDAAIGYDKDNGKVYLIGGIGKIIDANSDSVNVTDNYNQVRVYDIATKTWSLEAPLPVDISDTGYAQIGDTVYFTKNPEDTKLYGYNMSTKQLVSVDLDKQIVVHSERMVTRNGKIYAVAGFNTVRNPGTYSNELFEIDPITGHVNQLANLSEPKEDATLQIIGDKLYILGGSIRATVPNNPMSGKIESYDFNTNTWTVEPTAFPTPRSYSTSVVLNNEIIDIGGLNGHGWLPDTPQSPAPNYITVQDIAGVDNLASGYTYTDPVTNESNRLYRSTGGDFFIFQFNIVPTFKDATYSISNNQYQVSVNGIIDPGYASVSTNNTPQDVFIEYSTDNGTTWTKCGTNTAQTSLNNGSLTCSLPLTTDITKTLVRLNDGSNYSTSTTPVDNTAPTVTASISTNPTTNGTDGNVIVSGLNTTANEKALLKVVNMGDTCPSTVSEATTLGYTQYDPSNPLVVKESDNGKKICILAYDPSNNVSTTSINITGLDNTKPIVTTPSNQTIVVGSTPSYDLLSGVTVSDNLDTTLKPSDIILTVDGKPTTNTTITPNTVGTHTITYQVTDKSGNVSDVKTLTINVIPADKQSLVDLINTANKELSTNPQNIVSGKPSVDQELTNANTIVNDPNSTTKQIQDAVVALSSALNGLVRDTEKPVIITPNDQTIFVGSTLTYDTLTGVTVTDNLDKTLTNSGIIVTLNGTVIDSSKPLDISKVGDYTLTYNIKDSAGNSADQKTVTLSIKENPKDVLSKLITSLENEIKKDPLTLVNFDPVKTNTAIDTGKQIVGNVNAPQSQIDSSIKELQGILDSLKRDTGVPTIDNTRKGTTITYTIKDDLSSLNKITWHYLDTPNQETTIDPKLFLGKNQYNGTLEGVNEFKTIVITAVDSAGNVTTKQIVPLTVTTNGSYVAPDYITPSKSTTDTNTKPTNTGSTIDLTSTGTVNSNTTNTGTTIVGGVTSTGTVDSTNTITPVITDTGLVDPRPNIEDTNSDSTIDTNTETLTPVNITPNKNNTTDSTYTATVNTSTKTGTEGLVITLIVLSILGILGYTYREQLIHFYNQQINKKDK